MQTTYHEDKLDALKRVILGQIQHNVGLARVCSKLRVDAKRRWKAGDWAAEFSVCRYSGEIDGHMSAARELKVELLAFVERWR
jgi:hypothetical protein